MPDMQDTSRPSRWPTLDSHQELALFAQQVQVALNELIGRATLLDLHVSDVLHEANKELLALPAQLRSGGTL